MWFLNERAVTSVIATTKRPETIPYKEWLKLDNPLEGAGPATDRLREQLGDAEAPPRRES